VEAGLLERREDLSALLCPLCLLAPQPWLHSHFPWNSTDVNQELREILKLNLKPQDMYKRVMIMPGSFDQSQLLHYVCLL
jgi:hypothetical protein